MYVIEDKMGRFLTDAMLWSKNLQLAFLYSAKKNALQRSLPCNDERVFEVKLVLGKQVK